MTDFHQRFRERFNGCLHFVAEEHFPDILAFIDEVVAEKELEHEKCCAELADVATDNFKLGQEKERAALIEKLSGMLRGRRNDYDIGYNQALADVIALLSRE